MLYFQPQQLTANTIGFWMEKSNSQTPTTGTKKRENGDDQPPSPSQLSNANKRTRILNNGIDDDVAALALDMPEEPEDQAKNEAMSSLIQKNEAITRAVASLLMHKLETVIPIPRGEMKSHVILRVYTPPEKVELTWRIARDGSIWGFQGRIIRGQDNHVTVEMKLAFASTYSASSSFRKNIDQPRVDLIRTAFDKLCDGEDDTDMFFVELPAITRIRKLM